MLKKYETMFMEFVFPDMLVDRTIDYDVRQELKKKLDDYKLQTCSLEALEKSITIIRNNRENIMTQVNALLKHTTSSLREPVEDECPVCMDKYSLQNTFKSDYCQHVICKDCKTRCERCPICRQSYTPIVQPRDDIENLFNFLITINRDNINIIHSRSPSPNLFDLPENSSI